VLPTAKARCWPREAQRDSALVSIGLLSNTNFGSGPVPWGAGLFDSEPQIATPMHGAVFGADS
jgi:hypothetical protein